MDHLRKALQLRSVSQPFSYISIPVQAIIAALSVHKSRGGKFRCICGNPRASKNDRNLIEDLSTPHDRLWGGVINGHTFSEDNHC